jgi:hypothetical protein
MGETDVERRLAELKAKRAALPSYAPVGTPIDSGDYTTANWARMSPAARAAHNKLRAVQGKTPIPEPTNDLYVAPKPALRLASQGAVVVRGA